MERNGYQVLCNHLEAPQISLMSSTIFLMSDTEKAQYPKGYYACPKCNEGVEVFVPLNEHPTHHCGVGKKVHKMEYRGSSRASSRHSIG
jgi:hypothetical protein